MSRGLRSVLVGLGSLGVQAVALSLGLFVLAVSAQVTSMPLGFLSAGLAGYLATVSALVWLVRRRQADGGRRAWVLANSVLTLLAVTVLSVGILRPVHDQQLPPKPVAGLRWWTLSDGARVAYTRTSPEAQPRQHPIVFVHGGPGVADLKGDTARFGTLSEDGYEVYVYDQVGSGHSSRLLDPSGYTLDRWANDLEEIRHHIDADRLTLIGHSWGARVAARYAHQHPDHVTRLVLSSPGAIPGSDDDSGAGLAATLPEPDRRRVFSLIMHPRLLLSYGLLQIDPRASRNLTPDAEMDARLDRVYNASRAAYHCPGRDLGPELSGLGFYAYQFPQAASSPSDPDIRGEPPNHPTLVIKGQCDYLSWTSGVEYMETPADTRLVYLEDAGHNAYQDRPGAFFESVRAFLRGDATIPGERPAPSIPPGYQGPP